MNEDIQFSISVNDYNPHGVCVVKMVLDERGQAVDWVFCYCNAALAAMGAYKKEDMIGQNLCRFYPEFTKERLIIFYEAAYEGKSEEYDLLSQELNRYFHLKVFPAGIDGYCVCIVKNIEKEFFEKKCREQELERTVRQLENEKQINFQIRTFAAAMGVEYPLGIYMDYTNDSYEMIEYDNFLNKTAAYSGTIDDLITVGASTIPDEEYARKFYELFNRKSAMATFSRGEKELVLKHPQNGDDGTVHWMYTKVICMKNEPDCMQAISLSKCIDDEMEKEEYQSQLEEALKEADEANRAKSTFLLRMSHDIRTPLNGLMGLLEIAEKYSTDLEKQTECRNKIKDVSKIFLELINEVLDMSKLQSGQIVLENIPFSLPEVSKDVFISVSKMAEERDIEIVQQDCNAKHCYLMGSPIHYKRILTNIVSNAIKYNKDHGKIYVTCREIACDEDKVTIEFKCQDTGIGMSQEFQQHMFEPFTQENITARSKYKGTGLGMSIVKSLTEKMGGSLTIDSVKDQGTTVDIIIPFEIDKSYNKNSERIKANEKISLKGVNILMAEDNDLNMEIGHFLLAEAGASVTEAVNGAQALELFRQSGVGTYDAIIMDVMMPVMDGYETTRQIRKLNRSDAATIPIIAMTANAFVEDKIKAKEAGMNGHVAKPLDREKLFATIADLVEMKK